MCGIAGHVDLRRETGAEALAATAGLMAATLAHRGPDDSGIWADADCGVAFGHRRLAVIDLSEHGHQPMISADGRWCVTYNGEIYNYKDLRAELTGAGARLRGDSDTEVLVEGIARWGVRATVERCNGMFAFAAVDRSDRELWLARDRLGEKPLYYWASGQHFLFASETKALRANPRFTATIDPDVITLYLRHGYIPTPHSIFRGVSQLYPGALLRLSLRSNKSSIERYWSAREVAEAGSRDPLDAGAEIAADQLEALVSDSVRLRMVSDVPIGAFLSGGIDSSLVVALMQLAGDRPARTFTIGFEEAGYDEAADARRVADHLGTDHTELRISAADAMAVVPRLSRIYDEPFADSSQLPTVLVAELARAHVTVSLSGDGGDELFAGYSRYLINAGLWGRISRLPRATRLPAAALLRALPQSSYDVAARLAGRPAAGQFGHKVHKLAGMLRHGGPELVYRDLVSNLAQPSLLARSGFEAGSEFTRLGASVDLGTFVEQMMYLDTVSYLPDDILTKVDRAAMSVGLETRVPLLDHRLVEFAWRLPMDLKLRAGTGKWLLRQVLYRHVPRELVDRPKQGFALPLAAWLRGPLRHWADDLLAPDAVQSGGLLRHDAVTTLWGEHLSGNFDWSHRLWAVLMLQQWQDSTGCGR